DPASRKPRAWRRQRRSFTRSASPLRESRPIQPGEVGLGTEACLPVPLEQRFGLGQHQGVRPPAAAGLVTNRQLGIVDPGVDVAPALGSERPVEGASRRVAEELLEASAQLAATTGRELHRPLVLSTWGA